jgi:hypothetical protein
MCGLKRPTAQTFRNGSSKDNAAARSAGSQPRRVAALEKQHGTLAETTQRNRSREFVAEKTVVRKVTIAGHPFVLRSNDVVRALRGVDPEPITRHFVVIGTRRFPPKQVVSEVTGLDRADFTTHQARRTLIRLGFSAGRRSATAAGRRAESARGEGTGENLRLREFSGKWVAIQGEDVIHASDSPRELVGWLSRHGQKADTMFRVPDDELATTGLAPL